MSDHLHHPIICGKRVPGPPAVIRGTLPAEAEDSRLKRHGDGGDDAVRMPNGSESGADMIITSQNAWMIRTRPDAKLVTGIKEAGEIKAGRRMPSRIYEIKPPEIRVVRERLDVSQGEFAVMIGVSARTLQNWEQGRRRPEGPAKALLTIASHNPAAVLDALHGQRTGPTMKSRRFSTRAVRVSNA